MSVHSSAVCKTDAEEGEKTHVDTVQRQRNDRVRFRKVGNMEVESDEEGDHPADVTDEEELSRWGVSEFERGERQTEQGKERTNLVECAAEVRD
jgi:hypothetical protein